MELLNGRGDRASLGTGAVPTPWSQVIPTAFLDDPKNTVAICSLLKVPLPEAEGIYRGGIHVRV